MCARRRARLMATWLLARYITWPGAKPTPSQIPPGLGATRSAGRHGTTLPLTVQTSALDLGHSRSPYLCALCTRYSRYERRLLLKHAILLRELPAEQRMIRALIATCTAARNGPIAIRVSLRPSPSQLLPLGSTAVRSTASRDSTTA